MVKKYTPNVTCGSQNGGDREHLSPCLDTLGQFQVGSSPTRFGYQGTPGSQWPLPWNPPPSMCSRSGSVETSAGFC